MKIAAYEVTSDTAPLEPTTARRSWMDDTGQRFAYRCLPMNIANACGWQVVCPASFSATWSGGKKKEDLIVTVSKGSNPLAASHFGHGILTFHTGYLFQTPENVNLWVRGPINNPKPRIQALEGIVETDWSAATFTMNWMFTEPGEVTFEKGESFCVVVPYPRFFIEQFEGEVDSLSNNPELKSRYDAWRLSRRDFLENLSDPEHEAHKQRWQKDYMLGKFDDTDSFAAHQTKLGTEKVSGTDY